MIQSHSTRFVIISTERVFALLLIIGVLLYANLSRMPSGPSAFLLARITVANVLYAGLFLATWAFCFAEIDSYRESRFPQLKLWANIIKASSAVTVILAAILVLAKVQTPLHRVLPCFWLLSTALAFLRLPLSKLLERLPSQEKSRVIILGTGPMARRAWRELRTNHYRTVQVYGFVDTACFPSALPEICARYVGDVDDLETLLLRNIVDAIVIAIPAKSCYAAIQKAITVAEDVGIDLIQFDHVFP
jgi:FlaA1/EpsC-like NDP-sugar epimerase